MNDIDEFEKFRKSMDDLEVEYNAERVPSCGGGSNFYCNVCGKLIGKISVDTTVDSDCECHGKKK